MMFYLKSFIYLFLIVYLSEQKNTRIKRSLYHYQETKYYYPENESVTSSLSSSSSSLLSNRYQTNNENSTGIIIFRDDEKILSEGSFCRRSTDGRGGYCLLAYKCLHIVREFRKYGTKIDICTYNRKIPVICCPLEEKDVTSLEPSVKKRVSAIKCDEYNASPDSEKNSSPYPRYKKVHNVTKCEPSIPLIVGGEVTYPGEFPHMAAIGWRKSITEINWACGGTLISEKFVLTAAHCTNLGGKKPDLVKLGENNLRKSPSIQEYNISNIIINPNYKISSYYHDIALIKLNKNVILTKFIRPACLWQKSNFNYITNGIATGWGRTKFLGPKSDNLLKVDLKIINDTLCKKLYMNVRKLPNGIMSDYQFCAGHLDGKKDTCQGDSGGPLQTNIIKSKCIYYVIGITSFGKFCAVKNSPGVYTKVYPYLDWIESIVFQ